MTKQNKFKAMFNKAKKESNNGKKKGGNRDLNDLPEGKYIVQLTNAETFTSRESGKVYLKLAWCVLRGELAEEVTGQLRELTNEKTMQFLLSDLDTLGVDVEALEIEETEELLDVFLQLVEECTAAEVSVVHKQGNGDRVFVNMYINDLATPDDDELVDPKQFNKVGGKGDADEGSDGGADESSEEEAGDDDPAVGDKVIIEVDDNDINGVVDSVDAKAKTVVVKAGRKKHKDIPFENVFYDGDDD